MCVQISVNLFLRRKFNIPNLRTFLLRRFCSYEEHSMPPFRSFHWSNVNVDFFKILSTEFAARLKPPSRNNHSKAFNSRTQQRDQDVGWTQTCNHRRENNIFTLSATLPTYQPTMNILFVKLNKQLKSKIFGEPVWGSLVFQIWYFTCWDIPV